MARIDESTPFAYSATETALLILDYHSLFVQYLGAEQPAQKTITLKKWAKSQGILVAHAVIGREEDPPANTKNMERTTQLLDKLRADQGAWHEPIGIMAEADSGEAIFTRRAGLVSALTSLSPSDIKVWLAEKGIKSLILAGLSTGGCTLRTATSATDAGFVVTVIEDCCYDEPEIHEILVKKILPMRAHVFDFENFVKDFGTSVGHAEESSS